MIQKVTAEDIQENYIRNKYDIQDLFDRELKKIGAKETSLEKDKELLAVRQEDNSSSDKLSISM